MRAFDSLKVSEKSDSEYEGTGPRNSVSSADGSPLMTGAARPDNVRHTMIQKNSRAKRNIVQFSADDTQLFCKRNNLGLIIRSHQCVQHGFGYSLMHNGRLMRVFSARNFLGESNNAAAMLLVGYKRQHISKDPTHSRRGLVVRAKVIAPPAASAARRPDDLLGGQAASMDSLMDNSFRGVKSNGAGVDSMILESPYMSTMSDSHEADGGSSLENSPSSNYKDFVNDKYADDTDTPSHGNGGLKKKLSQRTSSNLKVGFQEVSSLVKPPRACFGACAQWLCSAKK